MNKTVIIFICIFSAIAIGNMYLESMRNKQKEVEVKGIENIKLNINNEKTSLILNKTNSVSDLIKLLPIEDTMKNAGGKLSLKLKESISNNPVKVNKVYKGDIMLEDDNKLIIYLEDQNVNKMYTKLGKVLLIDKLDAVKELDEVKVLINKG
ncbi:MAG: hypothetical protein IJ463_07450 [Bacilli bacterium]|nr:hypothetical protein [Bacilli bacterium]